MTDDVEKLEGKVKQLEWYVKRAIKLQRDLTESLEKSIRTMVGWLPGIGPHLDKEMEKQHRILNEFEKDIRKRVLND
jgi:hypothetical protein